MRQVKLKLYGIRELCPEARSKALDNNRDINLGSDWSSSIIDSWKISLPALGFKAAEVFWTGFYSQGDGACFDAEPDIPVLFEAYVKACAEKGGNLLGLLAKHKAAFLAAAESCDMRITRIRIGHYCHERTRYITLTLRPARNTRFNTFYREFQSFVEELRIQLCGEIYGDLEKEYVSLTDDEAVMEALDTSSCEFFADGRPYAESD